MSTNETNVDDSLIKKAILAAQIRMLYAQTPVSLFMGFLLASFVAVVFGQIIGWGSIIIWWSVMILMSALHLIGYIYFNKKKFSADYRVWYYLAVTYYLFFGLAWGLGLLWMVTQTSSSLHIFLFTVFVSLAAATISLSVRSSVYFSFQVSLLLPLIVWLILQNQQTYMVVGMFLTMFIVAMWLFAHQFNGVLKGTLKLNLENHTLASSLKHSNARLKVLNEELAALSATDSLTQVANRRYFDELFKKEFQRCSREALPIALIMIDADYFKSYNDMLGHMAGDEALSRIARCISDSIKRPTDLVARYGGEEFAVLLTNTSIEGALIVADEIRANVEGLKIPHAGSKSSEYITVSMGVSSTLPNETLSKDILISKADAALYKAKEDGRNQIKVAEYENLITLDDAPAQ